jgi:hypothetical protein
LRHDRTLARAFRHLALTTAVSALAAAGLSLGMAKPALAEFQIQEAEWDRGEIELEYRGAYHWGVPQVTEANPNASDLVQSHEFEMQMGITDWFLIQVTGGLDQPLDENFDFSSVEIEGEVSLIRRKGDGIGLAFQGGYEKAINHLSAVPKGEEQEGEPNAWGFGPIVELAKGPVLLTLNPLFTKQVGEFADAEGLGFEYGWRAEYSLNSRWGLGVEMFGEVEDLANAGSFNEQNHSIGPTIFLNLGDTDDEDEAGGDEDEAPGKAKKHGIQEVELNIGVQFGLTDATSDAALKFQGSLAF